MLSSSTLRTSQLPRTARDISRFCVHYAQERLTGLVHAISLDRIIYNFKKEVETMERAKNLLEHGEEIKIIYNINSSFRESKI